jgi:cobalt/nickel transport system permease protein
MIDALISPAVGGVMTAITAGAIAYSVKKISGESFDEKKIPMMGVMGAFIFAAQMIDFTIPGTGSSGHIGGGVLLAALLGPFHALITLASVILIQCLLFADGGLLAYGANVFNLGACASILAYHFLYKPIVKRGMTKKNITLASVIAVTLGLQVGAFGVVIQTLLSGVTELPFGAFVVLMQPIHLAIGLAEGFITAAVLCFVYSVRPEILESSVANTKINKQLSLKKVLIAFSIMAVLTAGGLSMFVSSHPDGLEWSIEGVTKGVEIERDTPIHEVTGNITEFTTFMPDYTFSGEDYATPIETAVAGLIGSLVVLFLAGGTGYMIHAFRRNATC